MRAKRLSFLIMAIFALVAAVSCVMLRGRSSCRLELVGGPVAAEVKSSDKILVVVTHGWLEKGESGWAEQMALAIKQRARPGHYFCGYFDWTGGATTLNPVDAAEYARDVGGARLAEQIINLGGDFRHIHLIGHSSGCWAVSEAAKVLAQETTADLHLTFLDAYVPKSWEESSLGDVNMSAGASCWAEHYYTRDMTGLVTERDLTRAHNVDITGIDQGINDHNFPWKWYYASITGKFPRGYLLDDRKLVCSAAGIDYGIGRGRETGGVENWLRSLELPVGNRAIRFRSRAGKALD